MYVIVVGAGAIGTQVLELVAGGTDDVVVVDRNADRATEASQSYDCLALHADATSKETLEEAGADRAYAVICTTESDATNIMVLLLADDLGVESLVSVVQQPEHMPLFRRIGANVLGNPQRLIAEHLVRAVKRPSIRDFMRLGGDAEIIELAVSQGSPIAGRTLGEAAKDGVIGDDALMVAVQRGDDLVTPRGDTRIEAGDVITVYSPRGFGDASMAGLAGPDGT